MISDTVLPPILGARTARTATESEVFPRVPGWQLVRKLGGGGVTEVFQARPQGTQPTQPAGYAIKTLTASRQDDVLAIELLRREARAGCQVKSPRIVPVLAANLHQSPYFIVMPYLPGASLADLLATGSQPVLPVALWITRQLAEALDGLQAAGWLHGDIKPSNTMIAPSGHVTLVDLGFARRLHPSCDEWLIDRPLTGTLPYLAPELLTSTLRVDIRSDLYSLGVMLYELLTGRVPFSANDPAELARQQREEKPLDARIAVPQLPTRVARLVRSMLAKDPARRPQTPSEVCSRLAALEIETFAARIGG